MMRKMTFKTFKKWCWGNDNPSSECVARQQHLAYPCNEKFCPAWKTFRKATTK